MGFPTPPEWTEAALCAQTDPELFFPEKGGPTKAAKQVCADCPVKAKCLDYALDKGERHGVWGGASETERRRLRKERETAPPAPLRPIKGRKSKAQPIHHGEERGYIAHRRRGEDACRECLDASRDARRRRDAKRGAA